MHRLDRRLQCRVGVEGDGETAATNLVERQHWGLAADDEVDQLRGRQPADASDLLHALGSFDDDDVGPDLDQCLRPLERPIEAFHGARVGTGDDLRIRVLAGVERGLDLAQHLVERNDPLAIEVAALLRKHLVLDLQGRCACALQELHGARSRSRCRCRPRAAARRRR